MVMSDFFMEALINKNILSVEYEVQQMLESEIITEASACTTVKQKNVLKDVLDGAKAYLKVEGSAISIDLNFIYIPKGAEDYVDMLRSNASSKIKTIVKTKIMDMIALEDTESLIRDEIKTWAIEQLRSTIGGVS